MSVVSSYRNREFPKCLSHVGDRTGFGTCGVTRRRVDLLDREVLARGHGRLREQPNIVHIGMNLLLGDQVVVRESTAIRTL